MEGFLFGFPCNDFSIVGETKGMSGKFGPLYKQGIRVLSRSDSPDWFLAENVGGLTSANEGKAFTTITKDIVLVINFLFQGPMWYSIALLGSSLLIP